MKSLFRFLAVVSIAFVSLAADVAEGRAAHEKGAAAPTAAQRAAYPLKTCLVTDEGLDDMGHPFVYTYQEKGKPDRVILLCCKDCVSDLEKEPAKYLKKLDAALAAQAKENKSALTNEQKSFLQGYSAVHQALAADDLPGAQQAAANLTNLSTADSAAAREIAQADSLVTARRAFKALSKSAVKLAGGQPGYFHAHCPMVPGKEGDWVQTSQSILNPYFGKQMLTCGTIKG